MLKYSFIIVNWNSKDFTKKAIDSILFFLKGKILFDVVVVDNDSKDNPMSYFQNCNYPKYVKFVYSEVNRGFAYGCNVGVKYAEGDFFVFFNNDAMFFDESFLRLSEYIEHHPNDIFGVRVLNYDYSLQDFSRGYFPDIKRAICTYLGGTRFFKCHGIFDNEKIDQIKEVDWVSGVFICLSKSSFFEIGMFPERYFMYSEDIELCFNAKKKNKKIIYFPSTSIVHYKGASMENAKGALLFAPMKSLILFYNNKISKNFFCTYTFKVIVFLGYLVKLRRVLCFDKKNMIYKKILRILHWQKY